MACTSFISPPDADTWPAGLRAGLYILALLFCFLGLGIVAGKFMEAMENIVHRTKTVKYRNRLTAVVVTRKERVWNPTIADITLLALGTSAPGISLAIIAAVRQLGVPSTGPDVGTGTMFGGAAFNFFAILAACILIPRHGAIKRVANFGVFLVELGWSIWAYVWLFIVLKVWTPGEITVVEGVVTVLHMPVLMVHAYLQDRHAPYVSLPRAVSTFPVTVAKGIKRFRSGQSRQAMSDMWVPEGVRSVRHGGTDPTSLAPGPRHRHWGPGQGGPVTAPDNAPLPAHVPLPGSVAGGILLPKRGPAFEKLEDHDSSSKQDTEISSDIEAPAPAPALPSGAASGAGEEGEPRGGCGCTGSQGAAASEGAAGGTRSQCSTGVCRPYAAHAGGGVLADIQEEPTRERAACLGHPVGRDGEREGRHGAAAAQEVLTSPASADTVTPQASPGSKSGSGSATKGRKAAGGGGEDGVTPLSATSSAGPGEEEEEEEEVVVLWSEREARGMGDSDSRFSSVSSGVVAPTSLLFPWENRKALQDTRYPSASSGVASSPTTTPTKSGQARGLNAGTGVGTGAGGGGGGGGGGAHEAFSPCGSSVDVRVLDTDDRVDSFFGVLPTSEPRLPPVLEPPPPTTWELWRDQILVAVLMRNQPETPHGRNEDEDVWQAGSYAGSYAGSRPGSRASSYADLMPNRQGDPSARLARKGSGLNVTVTVSGTEKDKEKVTGKQGTATDKDTVTGKQGTGADVDGEGVRGGERTGGTVERHSVEKWVEELSQGKPKAGDERVGEDTSMHSIHSMHSMRKDSALMVMKNSALELLPTAEEVGAGVGRVRRVAWKVLSYFWSVVFALLVPPPSAGGGWPGFVTTIVIISGVSAIVIELTSLLGCVTGINPFLLSITLLAAGTSVPNIIASAIAAQHSSTADSAIANVNCSNCINVYLGLGLPWLITSVYNTVVFGTAYSQDAASLTWSLVVYFATIFLGVAILLGRRYTLGGELGGPRRLAWASSAGLMVLWILFCVLAALLFLGTI